MLSALGHYNILDRMGAGGMGEVYRARDTRLGRTVAIKVLPDSVAHDPERRARLLREATTATALSHPNIAALFEIGDDRGRLFLVFEYVPGETLRKVIGGRPLAPRQAVEHATQLADALAEAHAAGVIHRDIKPDNIIITPKGRAKILDFGLARWTDGGAARETAVTQIAAGAGIAVGTLSYMSPEQALGQHVDERSDVYSLGAVLFEMLTGRPAWTGSTPSAMVLQIVQGTPLAPTVVNRNSPIELDAIVEKALARAVEARYQSAATFAAELRSAAAILDIRSGDSTPTVIDLPVRARPPRRRARLLIASASIVAFVFAAWMSREAVRRQWRMRVGPVPSPIIAVVPLELLGDDQWRVYFADGLTEDLITRLGQTPGLRILGRSATRAYRGRDPRTLAKQLGARTVLTGSVRPDGDQVKLTIELLDATDARQLWTRQYVRDQRNILAVQGEIAEEVATRMNLAPGSGAARARTASRLVDPAAYDLYLQGREALARRDLPQAIALFQTAITADAGLAEAHAGLAEVLILSAGGESGSADPRVLAQARQQADIAAASDPDLPDAELALASTSVSLLETLKHLRRSVELDGSYAEAYHKIGVEIMQFDPARAIGWYRKAIELDPRMDNVHRDAANAYTLLDRFADAEQELNKAGRGRPWWNWMAAKIQFEQSRFERGIAILGADRGFARYPPVLMMYASALASTGRTHEALGLIADAAAGSSALCERDAMVAALESETGAGLNAAKRVAQILDNATSAGGFTPNYSCAALAFAGAGRGDLSAGWLKRLAQDEPSLRQWATVSIVSSPAMALRRRWYPWNKVANGPALVEAERTLQDAYARLRADAATVLSGW